MGHMDDGCEPDMIKGLERKVDELAKEGVRSRMLVSTHCTTRICGFRTKAKRVIV